MSVSDTINVTSVNSGLRGTLCVPGDKSISHRVAILGALSRGSMRVQNYLCSEDCLNTLQAMQQLGARVIPTDEPGNFTLIGTGMQATAPVRDIDCGNSGTGMRLMAGVLSALPFDSKMYGDESLCSRPMNRIIAPLTRMGAMIEACGNKEGCAPLKIQGKQLIPIHYDLPMASAQVKSAILLAGMMTEGYTSIHQPAITRDHTERLFEHFSIPYNISSDGLNIGIKGPLIPIAKDITIPGDISSAAFWLVAGSVIPGSEIHLRHVGLNPTRDAVLRVLQRMGANLDIRPVNTEGEPYGDITVRYSSQLRGTIIESHEIPNLIDEIPILAVAAAFAQGETHIRNAAELRVKESDRIATTSANLRAMGGQVQEYDDGMTIFGATPLHGAQLPSFGDHRIAMSFIIAGLGAKGHTSLSPCANINTSYPGFEAQMRSLIV